MAGACPILTPEERKASEVVNTAKRVLMEKARAAIAEAAQDREQILKAGLDLAPAPEEYFDVGVHQPTYLTICGASVSTFERGEVGKEIGLIRNQQQIAHHQ